MSAGCTASATPRMRSRPGSTPDHGAKRFAEGARTRRAERRSAWAAQPDERGAIHRAGVAGVAAADDEERRKLVDIWLTATFGFKNRLFRSRNRSGSARTRRGAGRSRRLSLNRFLTVPMASCVALPTSRGSPRQPSGGKILAADRRADHQPDPPAVNYSATANARRNARSVAEYLQEDGWRERTIGAATTNGGDSVEGCRRLRCDSPCLPRSTEAMRPSLRIARSMRIHFSSPSYMRRRLPLAGGRFLPSKMHCFPVPI
jgi:hypothetical protein